ncbi:BAAT/acyl-CoA thioester hydrolase protein [Oribacterium sp. oral taxon 078 str. F0263]|nr:BAAT/acyl-CoA thioester hydrolase protein [Oribacterium sp. oral taxon 078 str. F0263]
MGLFESLHYSKMISSKRCLSLEDLPLYDYFNAEISLWIKEKKVAETTVKRYFKYPNIEYKNIVNANWLGRIFYRNTEDKAPCIIVLSGSDGGLEKSQNIAMLLASRGYVSLAMSYFGMDGQTPYLDQIPLENIQEALQILSENPHVDPNRIGIYGRSKGAEYALASISKFHEFKSAVLNAPSNQVYEGLRGKMNSHHSSWMFKNQEVPYTKFSILKLLQSKVLPQHPAKAPDSLIDVHDSGTNILLIASTKDEVWDSKNSALQIAKTIPAENCSIYFTTHLGHMNTISYQPNLRYGLKDLKSLHDEVKESWSKTILHFNKTL